jgi:hypothetical protein
MTDYDMSIHTNPDARAWAKFFIERNPHSTVDEGTMIGWFANAMMAMHDHMRPDLAPIVLPDGSAFVIGSIEGPVSP